jgi:hypothetical protein
VKMPGTGFAPVILAGNRFPKPARLLFRHPGIKGGLPESVPVALSFFAGYWWRGS